MKVDGKTVLVTGAANGIGRAVMETLLGRECKVCLVDYDDTSLQKTFQEFCKRFDTERMTSCVADVAEDSSMEEVFQQTVARFGEVDIVVNNAAILDETRAEQMLLVNLGGVIRGTTLALKYLSDNGVIVNMGSVAGTEKLLTTQPPWNWPVYTSTKAGIIAYTRCMASSVLARERNIRVCCFCPHFTMTEMGLKVVQLHPVKEERDQFLAKIMKPEEVADNIVSFVETDREQSVVAAIRSRGNVEYY